MTYILQILFMLIATGFMAVVLKEQWHRLMNTRTEYTKSRIILFVLMSLIFIGNFSHLEPGHLIHSILLALVGFTFWFWLKGVGVDIGDANKLKSTLEALARENAIKLQSVKIRQEAQSEAIAELSPKTAQKIEDLTAAKLDDTNGVE